jgi:hypothetical protein
LAQFNRNKGRLDPFGSTQGETCSAQSGTGF